MSNLYTLKGVAKHWSIMINSMLRYAAVFVLVPIVAFIVGAPLIVFAGNVSYSPVVIDEKGKVRDIIKGSIHLNNTSNHKVELYPYVNNVDKEEGQQAFKPVEDPDDRMDSLANWIELSRGVIELSPGEEREVPFVIRISLNALPGLYHANITFAEGTGRDTSSPKVVIAVNLEVQEDLKEVMQLNKFSTDNIFFSGDDILFNYQLQNIGNKALQPTGEIRIYDSKGKEVAALEVNRDQKTVSPDQIAQLASAWSAAQGFGKYKAFLTVNYGKNQTASVQDTVYFWIVPWKQLLALFTICLIGIVVSALYFHRRLERSHNARLALAASAAGIPVSPAGFHMPHIPIPHLPHITAVHPQQTAQAIAEEAAARALAPSVFKRILWMPLTLAVMPFYLMKALFRMFKRNESQIEPQVVSVPAPPEHVAPVSSPQASEPVRPSAPPVYQEVSQAPRSLPPRQAAVIDLSDHHHEVNAKKTQISKDVHIINLKDLQ